MLITLLNGVFFPLLTVALLKGLGFISSIYMRTSRDRIIPYIACNIFFFWTYTIFHKQENYPEILSSFWLGIFLASSAALLLNIYMKVSMHTIGAGGLLGLFLYLSFQQDMLMTWPFSAVLLTCGLVGTARLFLKSHNEAEIYVGFITGILSQLIAAYIIL